MVAITAAVVIAFKEIIMCFTGEVLLTISSSFGVGDRIEVGDIRGFVLEKGLLSVKLFEIGPKRYSQQATGDVITITNSLFLSTSAKNESYFAGISIKTFKFLVLKDSNRCDVEESFLNYPINLCCSYIADAEQVMKRFCHKEKITLPSVKPRAKLNLIEDKLYILLKMPVKNGIVADIEQKFIRHFVEKSSLVTL